jgi:hypothetical protein
LDAILKPQGHSNPLGFNLDPGTRISTRLRTRHIIGGVSFEF